MPRKPRMRAVLGSDDIANLQQLVNEAENASVEVKDFRRGSKSVQNTQDVVLDYYREMVKIRNSLTDHISETDLDAACFPPDNDDDYEELMNLLRAFFVFIVKNNAPRSVDHKSIGYKTLQGYLQALCYWVEIKYQARRDPPPQPNWLRGQLQTLVLFVVRKFELSVNVVKDKPLLLPAEIEQLIDFDLTNTSCLELAEIHHFAWILARTCALRPHSLGPIENASREDFTELPYLTYGDIEILRDGPARFSMKLSVRNVKGNGSQDPETGELVDKILVFRIKSPQTVHNLAMSPVYRFLVMCLRRNALQHYSSIEELLNDDRRFILVKNEFKNKPLLLEGGNKGRSVNPGKPLKAANLSKYLHLRGDMFGFIQRISFYSIRRGTATDWARALDRDRARELMGHRPGSRILEEHYLDEARYFDMGAIAGREDHTCRADEIDLDANTLALERLSPERMQEILYVDLNGLIQELISDDSEWSQHENDVKWTRNRRRVHRAAALKALRDAAIEKQRETITVNEIERRKDTIRQHKTLFNMQLLAMSESTSELNPSSANQGCAQNDADYEGTLDVPDENTMDPAPQNSTFLDRLDGVHYATAVHSCMKLLMENSLQQTLVVETGRCVLCVTDPSLAPENHTKRWTAGHLKRHILDHHGEGQTEAAMAARVRRASTTLRGGMFDQMSRAVPMEDLIADEDTDAEGMLALRMPKSGRVKKVPKKSPEKRSRVETPDSGEHDDTVVPSWQTHHKRPKRSNRVYISDSDDEDNLQQFNQNNSVTPFVSHTYSPMITNSYSTAVGCQDHPIVLDE